VPVILARSLNQQFTGALAGPHHNGGAHRPFVGEIRMKRSETRQAMAASRPSGLPRRLFDSPHRCFAHPPEARVCRPLVEQAA